MQFEGCLGQFSGVSENRIATSANDSLMISANISDSSMCASLIMFSCLSYNMTSSTGAAYANYVSPPVLNIVVIRCLSPRCSKKSKLKSTTLDAPVKYAWRLTG